MATLTIDAGSGPRQVTVDDSFKTLSAAEQESTVNEIAASIRTQPSPSAPKDTSFLGALGYGAKQAGQGLGATAEVVGNATGSDSTKSVGKFLTDASSGPSNYDPAGPKLVDSIRSGDWKGALSNTPRALAETLPDMGAALGAGVIGGVPGTAAYLAARNAGENVKARAANNNHAQPTTGDLVGGALTTIPQVAMGTMGLRVPGADKIASAALRGGVKTAGEAVAGGANSVVGDVGNSVGTEKGLEVDPASAAAAAIQSAGARAATLGAGKIGGAVKDTAGTALGISAPAPASLSDAASIRRIVDATAGIKESAKATSGRAMSDTDALNTLREDLKSRLAELGNGLKDSGQITEAEHRSIFKPALELAERHNKELYSTGDDKAPSAWDRLRGLDLDPQAMHALTAGMTDLTNLAEGARQNRQTGPFQAFGKLAGNVAGVAGGLMYGGPLGAMAGVMGHSVPARLGSVIGSAADSVLGTKKPTLIRQGDKASAMLEKAGTEAGDSPLRTLQDAINAATDPAISGGPSNVADPTTLGTKAAANQQAAMVARLGPDHPVGAAALDSLTSNGFTPEATRALAQWNAMADVRDTKDRVSKAAQASQDQAAQDAKDTAAQLKRDQQVKKGNATAAFDQQAQQERSVNLTERAADQVSGMAYRSPDARAAREGGIVGNEAINVRRDFGEGTAASGYDENGKPIQVRTPREPPQPRTAPPEAPPATTPAEAPQAGPQQAPTGSPGGVPLSTALGYLALYNHGHQVSPEHVKAGLDALASKGGMSPDVYESLTSRLDVPMGREEAAYAAPMLRSIASHAVGAKLGGEAPSVPPNTGTAQNPSQPPEGYRGPIYDPVKYQNAINQANSHADTKAALVAADPVLAATVANIRHEPSRAVKAATARAALESLAAEAGQNLPAAEKARAAERLALARTVLSGPLLQSKVK